MAKKDNRIWLKNIKTGVVHPANPVMLKYPDPDMMRVNGPEDATPVRPIVDGASADMSKWVDPQSHRGKMMKLGIPDDATGDFGDEPSQAAAPAVVTEAQIMAAISNLSPEVLKAILASKTGVVEAPADIPAFAPDPEVVGDIDVPVGENADSGSEVNKLALVIDAISQLDPADAAHYTKNNLPNAVVLTELVGFAVPVSLRDAAFAEFKKGQ